MSFLSWSLACLKSSYLQSLVGSITADNGKPVFCSIPESPSHHPCLLLRPPPHYAPLYFFGAISVKVSQNREGGTGRHLSLLLLWSNTTNSWSHWWRLPTIAERKLVLQRGHSSRWPGKGCLWRQRRRKMWKRVWAGSEASKLLPGGPCFLTN